MFRIAKTFKFEAAHSLPGLPEGHQCARVHGHSYTVEVVLTSPVLTGPGFVVDFAELRPLGAYIDSHFDHRDLTTVLDVPATSEQLAAHFYRWCSEHLELPASAQVVKVRVSETASSYAEYEPVLP